MFSAADKLRIVKKAAFNFKDPNAAVPSLPSTAAYVPPDYVRHHDYIPDVPSVQALPRQEPGVRPARAVPYELQVLGSVDCFDGVVRLHLGNGGKAAAVFQVRAVKTDPAASDPGGPWTYTVAPDSHLEETWRLRTGGQEAYDLQVHGPNGFFRSFKGSFDGQHKANLLVRTSYERGGCGGITLDVRNQGNHRAKVKIADAYTGATTTEALHPGESVERRFSLEEFHGWYDLTLTVESAPGFEQQIAGHVETGDDSMTDPMLGRI